MSKAPFRLPFGVAEGRPDLSALLNAREAFTTHAHKFGAPPIGLQ
jgi:hypothetical protein